MRHFLCFALYLLSCTLLAAQEFSSQRIPQEVYVRMLNISYPSECEIPIESLRYLKLSYYDFNNMEQVGEMVCNESIADDLLDIFRQLYDAKYQIKKIALIDEYGGSDEASMEDDNTSCFNYRKAVGSSHLSRHAYGLAVDINPLENPYVKGNHIEPVNASPYVDRATDFLHKITTDDLCYQLFLSHGFRWGGDWKSLKDYQHFEK